MPKINQKSKAKKPTQKKPMKKIKKVEKKIVSNRSIDEQAQSPKTVKVVGFDNLDLDQDNEDLTAQYAAATVRDPWADVDYYKIDPVDTDNDGDNIVDMMAQVNGLAGRPGEDIESIITDYAGLFPDQGDAPIEK